MSTIEYGIKYCRIYLPHDYFIHKEEKAATTEASSPLEFDQTPYNGTDIAATNETTVAEEKMESAL